MRKQVFTLFLGIIIGSLIFGTIGFAAGYQKMISVNFLPIKYLINGSEKTPPEGQSGFVYNGTTYVPLRFIAESLGQQVEWDKDTTSVLIGSAKFPDIASTNKIIIGSDATYPPFEQRNNSNDIEGFDIDLINALAEATGLEIEISDMSFDQLLPSLQADKVQAVVSAMTVTEPRKSVVSFSEPYFKDGQVVVVKSDNSTIQGFDTLENKTVAVLSGTIGSSKAEESSCGSIHYHDNLEQCFDELISNKVDAVICSYSIAANLNKEGKKPIKVVGDFYYPENLGIGVSKNNTTLLNKINNGLEIIKENGTYDKIYRKWFGELPAHN